MTEDQAKKAVESISKKPEAFDPAQAALAVQTYEVDMPVERSDTPPKVEGAEEQPKEKEVPKSTEIKPKEEPAPAKKQQLAEAPAPKAQTDFDINKYLAQHDLNVDDNGEAAQAKSDKTKEAPKPKEEALKN